ncbi:hypothetical protein JCM10212_005634 [Sporobolomyces blumeae]
MSVTREDVPNDTSRDSDALPLAWTSPRDYLASPQFHLSHSYRSRVVADRVLTVSYACVGSEARDAPVVVWINGMGHHRLAAANLDGICRDHGVKLVTVDRPGAGRSTRVDLGQRVETAFEMLVRVLDVERVSEFSLLTHSNGVIYGLETLVRLGQLGDEYKDRFVVRAWYMTSPWIPPSISGHVALHLATQFVPEQVTARLGTVALAFEKYVGPSFGWSSGIVETWTGWSRGWWSGAPEAKIDRSSEPDQPEPEDRRLSRLRQQRSRAIRIALAKPRPQQTFAATYFAPSLFTHGMKMVVDEGGMAGMGDEAVVSLRQGRDGAKWGWTESERATVEGDHRTDEAAGSRTTDEEYYREGFERLKRVWHVGNGRGADGPQAPPDQRSRSTRTVRPRLWVSVWYGRQDGMIPTRGQDWFKRLVVDQLELVDGETGWTDIDEAGHDEVLGLTSVVVPILERVSQHSKGGSVPS